MNSLQDMLSQLAFESGVIEDHAGAPDEITIVTDDTVTELEGELEDLADKIKETNGELDQVLEASDAVVSVESGLVNRINLLKTPAFANSYDKTNFALLWAGTRESFEGYRIPSKLWDDVTSNLSFEAEEGGTGKEQAEKDVKTKEGMIARFMKMLKAAANAAKAFFVRLYDYFTTSVEKNKRSAAILRKAVEGRVATPKDGNMKVGSYSSLVIGGKVDPVDALRAVDDGFNKHLKDAQSKTNAVVGKVADIMKRGVSGGGWGVLDKLAKGVGGRPDNAVAAASVISEFLSDFPANFTFELPGGRKAEYKVETKSTGAPTVSFGITKGDAKAPESMTTPALAEVGKIADAMDASLKVSAEINKLVKENIQTSDKLIAEAEAAAKKPGGTKEDEAPLRAVVGAVNAVLNVSKVFLPKYNELVLKVGHEAYRFGMAVAGQYPKKSADTSEKK